MVYASKAFPCTAALPADGGGGAVLRRGLGRRAAPRARRRLRPGADLHARQQQDPGGAGLRASSAAWATSWSTPSTRSTASRGARAAGAACASRPGIKASTHSYIQTGQADSKFGFPLADVPRAVRALRARRASSCAACTPTSARRSSTLEAFEAVAEVLAAIGDYPLLNLGGGLGIAYTAEDRPAERSRTTWRRCCATCPTGVTVLCEPGRSLVGNAGVTLYTRRHRQARSPACAPTWRWTAGMSDNLRPMLYGARYEAEIADRFGGEELCTIAGMHCESGRRAGARRAARRPAPGRRAGDPGHRRLRSRDGQQLQRACRARRWSSAATATPAWWCAARPSTI